MTRTLGGRYRLAEFLAGGETGDVWQAYDLGTGRTVAVKLLHPQFAADGRLVDRFQRARSELTALWHPGIARLLDIVVDDADLALVTDLVAGTDLRSRLARFGPLGAAEASAVAASMADALSAAHRVGVVHGDVKPSNVVVPPPESGPARLTDFSVALLVRAGTRHAEPSPPYRAPEVTDGAVPAPPSDVHALGVVLAEILFGDPYYLSQALETSHGDQVRRLHRIAAACIRRDLRTRPSAADVCHELRELTPRLEALGVEQPPAPAAGRDAAGPVANRRPSANRHTALRAGSARPLSGTAQPGPDRVAPGEPIRVAATHSADATAGRHGHLRHPVRMSLALVAVLAIGVSALFAVRALSTGPDEGRSTAANRTSDTAPGGAASVPGSAAPTLPTAATAHTFDGGGEFVRYWFAALTYAQQTGDTADLAKATSADCEACQTALRTITSAYRDGRSLRGGAYLVRRISTNALWTLDRPIYEATFDRSPRLTVDRSGQERADLSRLTIAVCVLVLEWNGDRWRVLELASGGCLT